MKAKIIKTHTLPLGEGNSKNPFLNGIATIEESATLWIITFRPYGFEWNTAQEWEYSKKSKSEKLENIIADFWKEYKDTYARN